MCSTGSQDFPFLGFTWIINFHWSISRWMLYIWILTSRSFLKKLFKVQRTKKGQACLINIWLTGIGCLSRKCYLDGSLDVLHSLLSPFTIITEWSWWFSTWNLPLSKISLFLILCVFSFFSIVSQVPVLYFKTQFTEVLQGWSELLSHG